MELKSAQRQRRDQAQSATLQPHLEATSGLRSRTEQHPEIDEKSISMPT